jgi:hypothetical protein
MAKKQQNFKLSAEIKQLLQAKAIQTRRTQTQIVEESVSFYSEVIERASEEEMKIIDEILKKVKEQIHEANHPKGALDTLSDRIKTTVRNRDHKIEP